jgi:hypothetical protein
MLFPRTHAWSPVQKWLIVGAAVCALIGASVLVYHFERDHRLPDDSILFGTWETRSNITTDWMTLKPDHTLVWSSYNGANTIDWEGVWYAGGKYIYVGGEGRPGIGEIIDVTPNQLRLRIAKQDIVFKRVASVPPEASNHAMERTADRFVSTF